MNWKTLTGVTLLAGIALAVAMPAEAAKKRPGKYIYYGRDDRAVYVPNRTRLVVQRRSFLDPGTETKQYDQPYHNYAFPPGYSMSPDRTNPNLSWDRAPMSNPWDLNGNKF
jgi:hypothetical protein